MKSNTVSKIIENAKVGHRVELFGWVKSKREHRDLIFIDLVDSTASIQVVISKSESTTFSDAQAIAPESSVVVRGEVRQRGGISGLEISAQEIQVLGGVSITLSPRPRESFDVFDPRYTDLTLGKRHLYIRNEKVRAVLKVRHTFFGIAHNWFRKFGFIEVHGPVIAQAPLYDDKSAFSLDFFGHKVFLNQCVAFYLESAVQAFEKVYNIGPSFRAEESKSRRHLAEYWHIKAEIAFSDFEDIINTAEELTAHIVRSVATECAKELGVIGAVVDAAQLGKIPYPRITYEEALKTLSASGLDSEFGESFGTRETTQLAQSFTTPFWITGIPRTIEPFPYVIDPADSRVTKTADLIATGAYGELLGVAEKIYQLGPLKERMREKGRDQDDRYGWYTELSQLGNVPHSGFGMGAERMIAWLMQLNHVRDAIPFPRMFNRSPYP